MNHYAEHGRQRRNMAAAQAAWDNLLPEDFEAPEPPPIDYEAYVYDWAHGNLAEPPGRDLYAEPLERLTEDCWLADLLAAKSDEEILEKAKVVRDKLEEFVRQQADEMQA